MLAYSTTPLGGGGFLGPTIAVRNERAGLTAFTAVTIGAIFLDSGLLPDTVGRWWVPWTTDSLTVAVR
jgi:hypothetical protein